MKTCSKCKLEKDEEEFYRRSDRPKARHSHCKTCCSRKDLPLEVRKHHRITKRKSNIKLRRDVLLYYTNGLMKCNCCGESNEAFLTLDHIEGGGRQHKLQMGSTQAIYRELRKNDYPEGYQILCYNCNCGRAHNQGVCPHEEM